MKTALICIVFAIAITGCNSSKKVVADRQAAESKFNDVPLTGISLDAMEPSSSRVYLTSTDSKFSFNTSGNTDKRNSFYQRINFTRDTVVFPATDTLKRFKN
jgi:hypothetical protein